MSRKIIIAYPRFKEFKDLAVAGDNVHEAMDFRLADAVRYIEEMDRQIERHFLKIHVNPL